MRSKVDAKLHQKISFILRGLQEVTNLTYVKPDLLFVVSELKDLTEMDQTLAIETHSELKERLKDVRWYKGDVEKDGVLL